MSSNLGKGPLWLMGLDPIVYDLILFSEMRRTAKGHDVYRYKFSLKVRCGFKSMEGALKADGMKPHSL